MADNYLQFSEILPRLTAEEEAWLKDQLAPARFDAEGNEIPEDSDKDAAWTGPRFLRGDLDFDPEYDSMGFQYAFDEDEPDAPIGWGRHLWLYADEWGEPYRVGLLVKAFLARFRPNDTWELTWASTCSKPRVGEFHGGSMFVAASGLYIQDPVAHIAACEQAARGKPVSQRRLPPPVELPALLELAEQKGLEPEDLDGQVHELASSFASDVNNGGLESQIMYLSEHLGTAEVRKLLQEHRKDPSHKENPQVHSVR
jgi:hypothetical protein